MQNDKIMPFHTTVHSIYAPVKNVITQTCPSCQNVLKSLIVTLRKTRQWSKEHCGYCHLKGNVEGVRVFAVTQDVTQFARRVATVRRVV